jgi:hypothetical protein
VYKETGSSRRAYSRCNPAMTFTRFRPPPVPSLRCCTCAAPIKTPQDVPIRGNWVARAKVQCPKCRKLPNPLLT